MTTANYFRWSDVLVAGFIIGVAVSIVLGLVLNVADYRASVVCARRGYPTVVRTSVTTLTCFKVENGQTASVEY